MADVNLTHTGAQLDAAIAAALSGGGGGDDVNYLKLLQGTINVETLPALDDVNPPAGDFILRPFAFACCINGSDFAMMGNTVTLPSNLKGILPGTFAFAMLSKIWIPESVLYVMSKMTEDTENPAYFKLCPFFACVDLTIYCEAESKPDGWDADWNNYDSTHTCPTNWGVSLSEFNAL